MKCSVFLSDQSSFVIDDAEQNKLMNKTGDEYNKTRQNVGV